MHDDTPHRLSAELDQLSPAQRRAVTEALQHSQDSGWPASETATSLLIAYAAGRIDARGYAREILVSLGAAPQASASRRPRRLEVDPTLPESAPASVGSLPHTVEARRISREEAVQAYVSGRIPVAEFLRIARGA